ncbi:hypothetical protein HU200_014814 [Digitaria exilis]|uniref:Embryonic flower 1-like protein n=1 Tax=Digitaria exilis TaxID=1010633 RepID=A0A835KJX1_9POAL|nr:hypothetical protein HU200_014814 [Digitaria exilis]
METAAHTIGNEAVEELGRLPTVAEPDDRPAELECDHFSMRGYVALQQKKDPKLCSLQIFCNQQQYDGHHNNSSPLFVANSPDSKAVTAVNVPATSAENTVPDTFAGKSVPDTKDLQGSANNLDVPENILNDVSMDVTDLPDVPQMISSKELNGTEGPSSPKPCEVPTGDENRTVQDVTEGPSSPKPCEVPTEDENRAVQDVLDVGHNESSVRRQISGHKGSKQTSGHKSNQVRYRGLRRSHLKRNVGPVGKNKKKKSTDLADISDLKFSQRKQKKTRLISELIDTQIGCSADAIEANHAKSVDICESDKSKMPLEAGNGNDTPVSVQKVCESQSTAVKNKTKSRGVDNFDDGPSLMNWLKQTHKKVRTEKRDTGHKNFDPSDVSNSTPDIPASSDIHDDSVPSGGDLGQDTSARHGNEKAQNNNLEQNMQKADELCQNKSENLKQRFLSNGESTILLKRKVRSSTISRLENPEGTVQRYPAKVSLGKLKVQNESGPKNIPKNKKKRRLEVHALPMTGSLNVYPPKLHVPDILECTEEQQTHSCRDEEVTIACTSPMFSHHQHIAEIPTQIWSNKGGKKVMWDSFKTASRNSPTSTYGFQFRNRIHEVDSTPIPVYGASNDYATHQPVIAAVDQYTRDAVDQVQQRSVPSTALTMEVGGMYDQRIAGQSGLYPKEPMPATHLLRLMDSSTARGFTNYQRANRLQMELETQNLGEHYVQHNHYNASTSTSYGSQITEKVPLTLHDLARHQVEKNLHRPLRPHPRVGVLGSLLQQDIANWSGNSGIQSGYKLGVPNGTTSSHMNRKANYETLNSGMFSAGWNALQLGSARSVLGPEHSSARYGATQPWTGSTGKKIQPWTDSTGKTVHPLDKLVRKDICVTNRNPADFTVISDKNEYMINL